MSVGTEAFASVYLSIIDMPWGVPFLWAYFLHLLLASMTSFGILDFCDSAVAPLLKGLYVLNQSSTMVAWLIKFGNFL